VTRAAGGRYTAIPNVRNSFAVSNTGKPITPE
jgi:hypothetical protein